MSLTFDKKSGRYRDGRGRFVSETLVRGTVEKSITVLEKELRSLAKILSSGKINLPEWQIKSAELIKSAHLFTVAAGKGGRKQMTPADFGRVGAQIREQYKHLNNLAREIEQGKLNAKQIESRIARYAIAARRAFFENEKRLKKVVGFDLCTRVLHAFESCYSCAAWAAKGYIPIDEQPEIGSLVCKQFCKCVLKYRRSTDPEETSTGYFFLNEEIYDYKPQGEILGQANENSCVPASARMILRDNKIDVPEAYLRTAFLTDQRGSYLSTAARVLNSEVGQGKYAYRELTFEKLTDAVGKGSAIVNLRTPDYVHALVVDKIQNDLVYLRDPLPASYGKAYAVETETFLKYWKLPNTDKGFSVIIK